MAISNTTKKILEILADGQFHSGTELAEQVGISRSAIWKHIRGLSELGLECHALSGKGYRLNHILELLNAQKILENLHPEVEKNISVLEVFDQIDSTNGYLMSEAGRRKNSGAICIAEYQRAGKGRRGREWVSPFGRNIYLSVLWHFSSSPATISALSLVVGVAVIRVLREINIQEIGLKWPNDIYWQGKKLAGILVEVSGEADGPCTAVIGLGLNMFLPKNVAQNISQEWVDLQQILQDKQISRNDLTALLINELVTVISTYENLNFDAYFEEWCRYDCLKNKQAMLYIGQQQFSGKVLGIDTQGLLLMQDSNGDTRTFAPGEVSFSRRG